MMRIIGIRELKEHTSQILREVREEGAGYMVTYHGRVIARLIPASPSTPASDLAEVWADLDQLASEIGANWPEGETAEDAVRDVRKE
jgi:prevent-host-death family protein